MGVNATILFTAEVAEKEIRGILGCTAVAFSSLGTLLSYVIGACLPWRVVAWCFCVPPFVLVALLFAFSAESPVWLKDHGKEEAARRSSMYFYNDSEKVLSVPVMQGGSKLSLSEMFALLFTTPAGLKPFVLINIMFILQQVVGCYITVYYGVTFIQESGSDLDPYLVTITIGIARFVFCTGTALSSGCMGRRPLMLVSLVLMAASMLVSATGSQRILSLRREREVVPEWLSWVVVLCIILNVGLGSMGPQILPWSMMAEIFPHEVRPVAQPINMATSYTYMFIFLQLYPTISYWLGGSVGIQFLFAGASIVSALFLWVFMLETRGLTLSEIDEYFRNNTMYLGHKNRMQKRLHTGRGCEADGNALPPCA